MGLAEIQMGLNRDARRERLMQEIKKHYNAGARRMFLLVPEQSTHIMTREVCVQLGDSASQFIEVIGFERLWVRINEACGGSEKMLDEGGRLLTMAKAVMDVRKELELYKDAAMRSEVLQDLLSTSAMLKLNSMAPSELLAASENLSPALRKKLVDISKILTRYNAICAEAETYDPRDVLALMEEKLSRNEWLKGTTWFIDGFVEIPEQQLKVVMNIMEFADYTMLSLACAGREDQSPSNKLVVDTLNRIYRLGADKDIKFSATRTTDDSSEAPALAWLQANLCSTAPTALFPGKGAGKIIKLYEDESTHGECMHIAGNILRSIRNRFRFRDISVVLCDFEHEAPVLDAVFTRYGIPAYFASRKETISKKPIMLAVNAALDAATRGMDKIDVLKYLKTGITGLPSDDVDVLEQYALTWNIHGYGWEPKTGWTMNPDGYGVEMTEDNIAALERINAAREKGIAPLLSLRDALKKGNTLGDYVMALYNFLAEIHFSDTMQGIVNQLTEAGSEQAAMEYAQVADVLNNAMDQMYRTCATMEKPSVEFVKMFKMLCNTYKIATIPSTIDQVQVYSLEDARFVCSKLRFIVGASEGMFPGYNQNAGGILNEADINELEEQEICIPNTGDYIMDRNLCDIATVVSGAKKMCVFTYSTENDASPSYLLLRVNQMYPDIPFERGTDASRIYPVDLMSAEMAGRLLGRISRKPLYDDYSLSIATLENQDLQDTALRVMSKAGWALGDLSQESVNGLYGDKISLSPTKSDVYSSCRYHYFLKYGLCLKEPFHGKVDAPVFGRFAHKVLESTVKDVESKFGGFKEITMEQLDAITRKHIDDYTKEQMRGLEEQPERYIYLYRRNCREVISILHSISEELALSDFTPRAFELKIGGKDADLPAIPIKGEQARGEFTGVTDRVDTSTINDKEYYRVLDYKTGKEKTLNMSDLLAGLSMQLLMYTSGIKDNGLPQAGNAAMDAAGMMYCPAKDPVVATQTKVSEEKVLSERQKEMTRHGMLLDDRAVLYAMEHAEDGKPKYLPVKYGADGTISGDICSAQQMSLLSKFTKVTMGEIVDGIASGSVMANPISRGMDRTACTYCPMKASCHKDSCGVKFRYFAEIKADDFWAKISKKVGEAN